MQRDAKTTLILSVCLIGASVLQASPIVKKHIKIHSILHNPSESIRYPRQIEEQNGGRRLKRDRNNCPEGHKYDPYFKKCRKLVCAVPGYEMKDGKCSKKD
ncbi:hypothetical protein NPIL_14251 [Nephila pilipes]|uniref:Spider venom protein n=1 Tax=Nephila pilipes TaxID=299642 RepID=A0A8X6Q7L9_NEPPI|nr:hypothetical protein NPIL_14251 [Nephila pilipes]